MKKLLFALTMSAMLQASGESLAASDSCDKQIGKSQYNKCVACHSVKPGVHKMGPSLHGLIGRKAGAVKGFGFSYAMEQAGFVWTQESLDQFLESPMQSVPGTVMPFGGMQNSDQRKALICYLQQFQ
ncbi:c-type cytochrome [Pseudomaricurvus alkylphenolicus]|uniref:c-type cytochrome n=1 Tax=Pseudomaricurvus alkylphenolicus TaxID=1306991 RepID=UPI0014201644|nr:c-type cytochrome [Pseudomaricurvus alkylphenolicus]NIB38037.1 c-type cytochrome [Pseudomaricurvus alkylphenolicus]